MGDNELQEEEKQILRELYLNIKRRDILADEMGYETKELREREREAIKKLVREYVK